MRLSWLAACAFAIVLSGCPAPPEPAVPTVPLPPAVPGQEAQPLPRPPAAPPAPKANAGRAPTGVPGTSIRFTGGDGSSIAKAIVIEGAKGEMDGVASEYQYLDALLGPRNVVWKMVMQSLLNENGKSYDSLQIERNGKTEVYYFDISGYFGKM
jgi:hypothetical protein